MGHRSGFDPRGLDFHPEFHREFKQKIKTKKGTKTSGFSNLTLNNFVSRILSVFNPIS